MLPNKEQSTKYILEAVQYAQTADLILNIPPANKNKALDITLDIVQDPMKGSAMYSYTIHQHIPIFSVSIYIHHIMNDYKHNKDKFK